MVEPAATPSSRALKVLTFSRALPHDLIDHAGGVYVCKVIEQLLAAGHRVTVVAPGTTRNVEVAASRQVRVPFLLAGREDTVARPVWGLARRLVWRANPSAADPGIRWALILSRRVRADVRKADVVDLQWTENTRLAAQVRRINPHATLVATFHDVSSQKFERRAHGAAGRLGSLRWRLAAAQARRTEQRIHRLVDHAIVLSAKDAALLPHAGDTVAVVDPPLYDDTSDPGDAGQGQRPSKAVQVLFVGAMARPENDDAALWLLQEVWPYVTERVPRAELSIVGGSPSEELRRRASTMVGVEVTGFVDELGPRYQEADVAVVPLRFGAGVKFKTIDALIHQVPVVATAVGAEGIHPPELFWAVVDEPRAFAGAVISALEHLPDARRRAARSAELCRERYGTRRFAARLAELYR